MLLDRLEPGTAPHSWLGLPSHPDTVDRARAVRAYPGEEAADPIAFDARFFLGQARHAPTGGFGVG